MRHQPSYISCGVTQVYDLELLLCVGPEPEYPYLRRFAQATLPHIAGLAGIYVFSDADGYGNGKALVQEIRKVGTLGDVVEVSTRNPNSGNHITAWLFAPNWVAFSEFARDHLYFPQIDAEAFVFYNGSCLQKDEWRKRNGDWLHGNRKGWDC